MLEVTHRIRIPLYELEFSYVRSSGPGGQNVNKVNSKCVMRWRVKDSASLPIDVGARFFERFGGKLTTEGHLVLTSDTFRDQKRNYEECLDKLKAMLLEVAKPPKIRKATKPTRSSQRRRVDNKRAQSSKKANRKAGWD